MSSNWGYLTMRFLHANLMYRTLLPVHHLNVSLYANFVHAVHEQADNNLYHNKAPWWHCVPLMQLLEQRTKLQCVPLMSSRGRYSGFPQEFLHPSCDWIQGLKALIYSCFFYHFSAKLEQLCTLWYFNQWAPPLYDGYFHCSWESILRTWQI